jgi:hypothetical protein
MGSAHWTSRYAPGEAAGIGRHRPSQTGTKHEEALELKPTAASSKRVVTRRQLTAFSLVILGALLTMGSALAFLQDYYLRLQDSCGTVIALQPICTQIADNYGQVYALAIVGMGVTIVGFYVGATLGQMRPA